MKYRGSLIDRPFDPVAWERHSLELNELLNTIAESCVICNEKTKMQYILKWNWANDGDDNTSQQIVIPLCSENCALFYRFSQGMV